eukprot:TRINITY_DN9339_c1_g4_i1.p1 TRINITY_DN9339_c1_g4~~TRINITY_DN9339_c1_g4_i1.p1  ORF type:complete len:313 (-),score=56.98 TRINITY_DN9339_c1_g4_i1:84-959(-)
MAMTFLMLGGMSAHSPSVLSAPSFNRMISRSRSRNVSAEAASPKALFESRFVEKSLRGLLAVGLLSCVSSEAMQRRRRSSQRGASRRPMALAAREEDEVPDSSALMTPPKTAIQEGWEKYASGSSKGFAAKEKGVSTIHPQSRKKALMNPPLPEGVRPYEPGEGYASNAIPFAGISAKVAKDRRASVELEVQQMVAEAQDMCLMKKHELQEVRTTLPSQTLPIPEDRFLELRKKGWLDYLVDERELEVEISSQAEEAHDVRWIHLKLSGDPDNVQAGMRHVMSALMPQRLG